MHDLVGIAAQQEVAGLLQRLEYQRQLDTRDVLHFVDDHEVVAWRGQRLPFVRDQVEVEQFGFGEPGAVFFKQIVEQLALIAVKDRLPHAERAIGVARQHAAGIGGDDAADFLERLVCVDALECLLHACEPAGKVAPQRLPSRRHADRLDEFSVGQEYGFLSRVFETIRIVEVARILRQVGGMGDVQHLAFGMLHFFQRQRGLAAAGAADHDQRRRLVIDRLLRIIERNRFVEQVDGAAVGMQIAQRLRLPFGLGDIAIGNLRFVDGSAAQETRLVVVVMLDHFQHQRANFIAMAHQRE